MELGYDNWYDNSMAGGSPKNGTIRPNTVWHVAISLRIVHLNGELDKQRACNNNSNASNTNNTNRTNNTVLMMPMLPEGG